jgi:hypothetical protein
MIQHNIKKLEEIRSLLGQLPSKLYSAPKEILSQSSIGQHFRHVLEFYICLQKGASQGTVCYDDRERDLMIETSEKYAVDIIDSLLRYLKGIKNDRGLAMHANFSVSTEEKTVISTTLFRELAYALDHTVHHLAMVKIALTQEGIELDSNFGVASSTLRFQQVHAQ